VQFTANASDPEQGNLSSTVTWTFPNGSTATGATASFAFAAAGTYAVTATVTDNGGLSASSSTSITVTDPIPNTAPVLTLVAPAGGAASIQAGQSVTFSATASDAEQGDVTSSIRWTLPSGTVTGGTVQGTFNSAGTFTVTGSITDAGGLSASVQVIVTVTAPPPPAVPAAPTGLAATLASRTVRLAWTDNASNETGYYVDRAKVNNNGSLSGWTVIATLSANTTTFGQAQAKGTYAFRVRAYNAGGAAASNQVRVTVR
jgi:PKD repeat protein